MKKDENTFPALSQSRKSSDWINTRKVNTSNDLTKYFLAFSNVGLFSNSTENLKKKSCFYNKFGKGLQSQLNMKLIQ